MMKFHRQCRSLHSTNTTIYHVMLLFMFLLSSQIDAIPNLFQHLNVRNKLPTNKTSVSSRKQLLNSAILFIKPHANTAQVQELVEKTLATYTNNAIDDKNDNDSFETSMNPKIRIKKIKSISSKTIESKKLIDRHYYSIACKATLLSIQDISKLVPKDLFQSSFNEDWDSVLKQGLASNAIDACSLLSIDQTQLYNLWRDAEENGKVVKLGGGFYCGKINNPNKESKSLPYLYVFNAFFLSMRNKFVQPNTSIHVYEIEWDQNCLSWRDFRSKLLGSTDPSLANKGSLRNIIYEDYTNLGLLSQPTKGDNGVHGSASPFEGLAEKINWLSQRVKHDAFGKLLLKSGISQKRLEAWFKDPVVKLPDGSCGSLFDALEDLDVDECLDKLLILNKLQ